MKQNIFKLLKVFGLSLILWGLFYLTINSNFGIQLNTSIQTDPTIKLFSILIVVLTGIGAVFPLIFNNDKFRNFVFSLPSLLPALGLVGTFIGIFLGLSEFNPADIDGSLPKLLAGLKVAFSTSILGIIGSLIVKVAFNFHPEIIQENSISEADFYVLFEKQNKLGEQTITKLQELRNEFENFSNSIGDSTIEHLVNAIERVMDDFNRKVETQFGENFKKFNDGLALLLSWQENYKNEVETHLISLQKTQEILKLHEKTSEKINEMFDGFVDKSKPITALIEKLDSQRASIEQSIINFNKIALQANEIIPTLESQVTSLNNELSVQLLSITEKLKTLDDEIASELEKALNILSANLGALTEQMVQDYQPLMVALRNLIESAEKARK